MCLLSYCWLKNQPIFYYFLPDPKLETYDLGYHENIQTIRQLFSAPMHISQIILRDIHTTE